MQWDLFCRVIDNWGDVGVCWRLAAQLAARGHAVRLWIDDPSPLAWMAPRGQPGVEVMPWSASASASTECAAAAATTDAVVEAFGCDPDPAFVAAMAARTAARGCQPAWINLEYLSAESFAERAHGLASPVMAGHGRGLTKRFFYPGFTERTGGLLREPDLLQRQAAFDRLAWKARLGLPHADERLVSLFCYEPATLRAMLRGLARAGHAGPAVRVLVTAGRAAAAVQALLTDLAPAERPAMSFLPLMEQTAYDELLWGCEWNFVRGEDSLVRALWAGKPFVWQLYPQDDLAHHPKVEAFLDWIQAPVSMRTAWRAWNGIEGDWPAAIAAGAWPDWAGSVARAREQLLGQDDLVTRLLAGIQHPK